MLYFPTPTYLVPFFSLSNVRNIFNAPWLQTHACPGTCLNMIVVNVRWFFFRLLSKNISTLIFCSFEANDPLSQTKCGNVGGYWVTRLNAEELSSTSPKARAASKPASLVPKRKKNQSVKQAVWHVSEFILVRESGYLFWRRAFILFVSYGDYFPTQWLCW